MNLHKLQFAIRILNFIQWFFSTTEYNHGAFAKNCSFHSFALPSLFLFFHYQFDHQFASRGCITQKFFSLFLLSPDIMYYLIYNSPVFLSDGSPVVGSNVISLHLIVVHCYYYYCYSPNHVKCSRPLCSLPGLQGHRPKAHYYFTF